MLKMNLNCPPRGRATANAGGFTLVELMVSLAISLLLMFGVNEIFKMAGRTVGAGQVISEQARNSRAAQSMFSADFHAMVPAAEQPALLIENSQAYAFLNQEDEGTGMSPPSTATGMPNPDPAYRAADPETYVSDKSLSAGTRVTIPAAIISNRSHRLDMLSFFARGQFTRQTGPGTSYFVPSLQYGTNNQSTFLMTTNEAWITYGHLLQASLAPSVQSGTQGTIWRMPGQPANAAQVGTVPGNPTNAYATQWVLGRRAILLSNAAQPTNSSGTALQVGWYTQQKTTNTTVASLLNPLSWDSVSDWYKTEQPPLVQNYSSSNPQSWVSAPDYSSIEFSRYDMARTSIDQMRSQIQTIANYSFGGLSGAANTYAWDWAASPTSGGFISASAANGSGWFLYRSFGKAWLYRPSNYADAAYYVPAFLPNCTQFIVEYAGDFVSQDWQTGNVADLDANGNPVTNNTTPIVSHGVCYDWKSHQYQQTDGQIDYVIDGDGARRIRWYGFPRDTAGAAPPNSTPGQYDAGGDNLIPGNPNRTVSASVTASSMPDVVPLVDVWTTFDPNVPKNTSNKAICGAPFEKTLPPPALTSSAGYADSTWAGATNTQSVTSNGTTLTERPYNQYRCEWAANDRKPLLIRITFTLQDPNGRTPNGQTFQYIFPVPQ